VVGKSFFVQLPLASLVGGLNVSPFKQVTVQEMLWGYEDSLYEMAKPLMNLVKEVPDKLGLLVGVSHKI
jgi:hypothetical protein